ncbi:MAG: carbohydrate kinase family protein [Candidatus Staskawiczbacteria bacterium]|nr:carbohydrate kinase family protein [Candidatus Staskawiczbacteria bacterium]
MFDIITFGSATQDIIIKPKKLTVLKYDPPSPKATNGQSKEFTTGKGVCFPLGSKIDIEDIKFSSGGGGTNTAVTFVKQGFKTAFCGIVGNDISGKEIIEELKKFKINTSFILKTSKKPTNHSIVILNDNYDRTILTHRGAAELMGKNDIPWNKLKAKWIYLAPLSGLLCDNFENIVDFAFKNKIKIAVNPGMAQLSLPKENLENIFKKVDVLILNQEEASFLTKISYENEDEIFKKIDEICSGVVVMTKGGEGVVVSDGKYIYSAKPNLNRKVVDTTGAGDSFASGFISDYIRHNGDIEKSIQLGMANSEGNLSEIGAKTGLLDKNSKFERVPISKTACSESGICSPR